MISAMIAGALRIAASPPMHKPFVSPVLYIVCRSAGFIPDLGRWIDRVDIGSEEPEGVEVAVVCDERDWPLATIINHGGDTVSENFIHEIAIAEYADGVRPVVTLGWADGGDEIIQAVNVEVTLPHMLFRGAKYIQDRITIEVTPEETRVFGAVPSMAVLRGAVVTDQRITIESKKRIEYLLERPVTDL